MKRSLIIPAIAAGLLLPAAPALVGLAKPAIIRPAQDWAAHEKMLLANFLPGMMPAWSRGGVSAEVAQFLARTTSLGSTYVAALSALIDGLVADGVWPLIDCLYYLASDSEVNAKLNLKSSSFTITETGSVTFTAGVGYDGAAGDTSNYLDTGFNPSTAGGNYTQNNAHISYWANTSASDSRFKVGARVTNEATVDGRNADGNAYFRINSNAFSGVSVSNASAAGHYIGSRSASGTIIGYKNGSQIVSGSDTSVALVNGSFGICGIRAAGGFSSTAVQESAVSFGGALDTTKSLALYNRLATCRTALGL